MHASALNMHNRQPITSCCLQGTDASFATKLRQRQGSHPRFSYNPKVPSGDFTLHHYAGPVIYSCNKFLDKNKDTLSPGGCPPGRMLLVHGTLQWYKEFIFLLSTFSNLFNSFGRERVLLI